MMFDGYGWSGMGFGFFGMLLFWVVLIAGVVALLRWTAGAAQGARPATGSEKSALDILSERYARGEIDRAEFTEKRADLSGGA